jgi:thermostable 8-oxoguanine DNA glycosylase
MSPAAGAHWQSIVRGQRRRLELYKNRDEITDNEKWRQELEHCTTTARSRSTNTTRLAPKYELTGTR